MWDGDQDGDCADQDRDQDDQNEGKREPGAQRHVPAPPVFVATIMRPHP
jgi:hypothetical protein